MLTPEYQTDHARYSERDVHGDRSTGTPGRERARADTAQTEATAPQLDAEITHLVANSAVQFFDFTISDAAANRVVRRYIEEAGSEPLSDADMALYAVELDDTGTLRHPATSAILPPERCFGVRGSDALATFAGRWLPLPYMRLALAADGSISPSPGPANWVRLWIAKDDAIAGWRIVVAFDTALSPSNDADRCAVMPSDRDIADRTIFGFSDDVAHIEWFVTQAWVDRWLKGAMAATPRAEGADALGRYAHAHTAAYLTLLNVLSTHIVLPDVRFDDAAHRAAPPADLVIALGFQSTHATLVRDVEPHAHATPVQAPSGFARSAAQRQTADRSGAGVGGDNDRVQVAATALTIRDLSQPTHRHSSPLPSTFAFSPASFGDDYSSRASGRVHAFAWPSPGRVGVEAARLSARDGAPGSDTTGRASVLASAWDMQVPEAAWRYVRPRERPQSERHLIRGPLVQSLMRDHAASADRIGEIVWPRFPATRLIGLYVAEVVLQALSSLGTTDARRGAAASTLRSVVLSLPAAISQDHAQHVLSEVKRGLSNLWTAMGWPLERDHKLSAAGAAPALPSVKLGCDSTTSTVTAFLEQEVARRFSGQPRDFLALLGQDRETGDRAGVARSLRVAAVDVGTHCTSLVVDTWHVDDAGKLTARRMLADGFQRGSHDTVSALADAFLLPALLARLHAIDLPSPGEALRRILGLSSDRATEGYDPAFHARFFAHIAQPFAHALFDMNERLKRPSEEAPSDRSLQRLLGELTDTQRVVLGELDRRAAREGAGDLGAAGVTIPVLHRDVVATLQTAMRPWLTAVADTVRALDCDLVVLMGRAMALPALNDLFHEAGAIRPDRIVNLTLKGPSFPLAPALARGQVLLGQVGTRSKLGSWGRVDSARPSAATLLIGVAGAQDRLTQEAALFSITPTVRARLHDEPHRPTATVTFTERDAPTATLSARHVALERWPSRPHMTLRLTPDLLATVRAFPVRVTVELLPPKGRSASTSGTPGVRVVKVRDAVGTQLANADVEVTFTAVGAGPMRLMPSDSPAAG